MLYKYEYIYENETLKVMGDDADKIVMNEMCHKFAEMLPQSVELKNEDYDNKYSEWHHGKIYKAEFHAYHPDEMKKIIDIFYEIGSLGDRFSSYDYMERVKELGKLLGLVKPSTEK